MRIGDWTSAVCSADLSAHGACQDGDARWRPSLPASRPAYSCGCGGGSALDTEMTPPDEFPYSAENGPRRTSTRPADSSLKCDTWPWPSGMVAGMPSLYRRTPRMPKLARVQNPPHNPCQPCAWSWTSLATTTGPHDRDQ